MTEMVVESSVMAIRESSSSLMGSRVVLDGEIVCGGATSQSRDHAMLIPTQYSQQPPRDHAAVDYASTPVPPADHAAR